jgi:hypothetical protein
MLPIEEMILEKLRYGPCSLDDVVTYLSIFDTEEIFVAIDRMSRDGRVLLRQNGYSAYQLSLGSQSGTEALLPRADMERGRGSPTPEM